MTADLTTYERKLDDLMAWAKRRLPSKGHLITRPTLAWMPKPSARINGMCWSTGRIELNRFRAIESEDTMLEETLPHEFAHHITFTLFPEEKQKHGPKFRAVCEALGISGKAKTLAYTGEKKHRRLKATCPCGNITSVTYTLARRISMEGKIYKDKNCGGVITLPINFGTGMENSGDDEFQVEGCEEKS